MTQSYMPSKTKSDVHITPDRVYSMIEQHWGYLKEDMFDPCPVGNLFDGLNMEWTSLNYVNPPYEFLKEFVSKAITESFKGNISIMLLPSKTDQLWFHIIKHYEILWIEKRLKFKNNRWSSPQPHFLVRIK